MQAELKLLGISNVGIHNLSPGMVTTELLMAGESTPLPGYLTAVPAPLVSSTAPVHLSHPVWGLRYNCSAGSPCCATMHQRDVQGNGVTAPSM